MTFIEYLNRHRVRMASRMLAESDAAIVDIGNACGFESLSYFYKRFRQIAGLPPRAWRLKRAGGR